VSFIVRVALCAALFERRVLFSVICAICVLYLIAVSLPPGKNQFAVQLNNNIYNNTLSDVNML
jgi:hypothetical protein